MACTFRLIGSKRIWERGAALTSRLQSFETTLLTQADNLAGLAALNRELIARAEALDSPRRVVLDIDSTEVPVYGQQEHSAYNGHFESTCYHPLLLFNREGDCLAAKLRPGNVHSAEAWEELLLPEIERQQLLGKEVVFRADAAFSKPEVYAALEERKVKHVIRLPANDTLERNIRELLIRPVGRPSYRPVVRFKSFLYRAASWPTARRVGESLRIQKTRRQLPFAKQPRSTRVIRRENGNSGLKPPAASASPVAICPTSSPNST